MQSVCGRERGTVRKIKEKGLSHIQSKAVIEFISPDNGSQKEIAKKLGITTRTIRYWLNNPRFQSALKVAMEDLRRTAISASAFSVEIQALRSMVDYDLKIVEDFDIKGAIIQLGQNQAVMERNIKENSEEIERLKTEMRELKKGLIDSGKG